MLDIEFLRSSFPDFKIKYFSNIDSTNSEAKRQIIDGETGKNIYIASHQTSGRGRQGKSFYSPADTGLYLSFAYPSSLTAADPVLITSQSAVAVAEAIEESAGVQCGIKWVNDIYIGQKKVSGILAESVIADGLFIIVGIGINLFTKDFPDDIKDRAGSVNRSDLDVNHLAVKICEKMSCFIRNPKDKSYLPSYKEHSIVLGKNIEYIKNSVKYEGTAVSITDEAYLTILKKDGTYDILNSGEISLSLRKM